MGSILGRKLVVHDEVPVSEISSRPDFAVDAPTGRVGYVELKAPEKDLPPNWRPNAHDRQQWEKLRVLPNLLYSNGASWSLFRKGNLVGSARLVGDLSHAGDKLEPADDKFEDLVREFLVWVPAQPTTLREIVSEVAPLCRLLRDQVRETMVAESEGPGKRPFTQLASEWRSILFPNLDDRAFADAYAQTVSFALLLARVDGIDFLGRSLKDIADKLGKQHSLMGEALAILTDQKWVTQLSVVETLHRVVGAIDWTDIRLSDADAFGLLYEKFLAEYDPDLRRSSGTYYTPDLIARAMVNLTDEVLKARLSIKRGFAGDDVIVVDPAMGTGTFLVEIMESVASTLRKERGTEAIAESHLRELFSQRLVGFELQAAPYAVAELRLHSTLKKKYGVEVPRDEVRFLSNTFDDPDKQALEFGLLYDVLSDARQGANRIKRDVPVMVVIGNPPWREGARGEAPWLEKRRDPRRPIDLMSRPSLDEFRARGQGRREFNLSNMWTFFWRWATWKVFDAHPSQPAGVVAFITPSAYLTSESHAGMRRYLRETTDEGWVIDLTPEGFQPRVSTRLFPGVQQPICIGIFARYGAVDRMTSAIVHHIAIAGTRQAKTDGLLTLRIDAASWRTCSSEWQAPFKPTDSEWESFPKLSDLLPWHQPGVKPNRNWVYAPDPDILQRRWSTLRYAADEQKATLFKETSDRSVPWSDFPNRHGQVASDAANSVDAMPRFVSAAFRSFDRQYLIQDVRVIDRPRPELWQVDGEMQVYVSEQHTQALSSGPALTFSSLIPNMDCFMGHHGGRVLPLFRDGENRVANISPRLLELLAEYRGRDIRPGELLAYVAGIAAHSGYTARFREELAAPGIRMPLTAVPECWEEAIAIGSEVLWLHTYGERYVDEAAGRPRGSVVNSTEVGPLYVQSIPTSEELMPDAIEYDVDAGTLIIGDATDPERHGRIERVSPEVWNYAVGGMPVVRKWFSYRQRNPRRKKRTSPLDDINSMRWTAKFDDDLLALLHVLDRCVALEPSQAGLLNRVCAGPLISISELARVGVLPVPESARKPPRRLSRDQNPMLGDPSAG
ncbi:MAG TPA: type ISP restriction/modification enzyme [Jiangellaceae bacterium]